MDDIGNGIVLSALLISGMVKIFVTDLGQERVNGAVTFY